MLVLFDQGTPVPIANSLLVALGQDGQATGLGYAR